MVYGQIFPDSVALGSVVGQTTPVADWTPENHDPQCVNDGGTLILTPDPATAPSGSVIVFANPQPGPQTWRVQVRKNDLAGSDALAFLLQDATGIQIDVRLNVSGGTAWLMSLQVDAGGYVSDSGGWPGDTVETLTIVRELAPGNVTVTFRGVSITSPAGRTDDLLSILYETSGSGSPQGMNIYLIEAAPLA